MKTHLCIILLAAALLLSACETSSRDATPANDTAAMAGDTPPSPSPQQAQPAPAPAQGGVQEIPSGVDKTFGPVNTTQVITLDDVRCDASARSLTFRFRNTDPTHSWQLNEEVPFPAPADLVSVRVMVNQYEANAKVHKVANGETLFGPQDRFSDNCGGIEVLAPNESVTCTVSPVPIVTPAKGDDRAVNDIFVNSPGPDGEVRFSCT